MNAGLFSYSNKLLVHVEIRSTSWLVRTFCPLKSKVLNQLSSQPIVEQSKKNN